jgi:hypothetical protein
MQHTRHAGDKEIATDYTETQKTSVPSVFLWQLPDGLLLKEVRSNGAILVLMLPAQKNS